MIHGRPPMPFHGLPSPCPGCFLDSPSHAPLPPSVPPYSPGNSKRTGFYEAWVCVSNQTGPDPAKTDQTILRSEFANRGKFLVRRIVDNVEMCAYADMTDPTQDPHARVNTMLPQEAKCGRRRQYCAGTSFHNALRKAVYEGMGYKCNSIQINTNNTVGPHKPAPHNLDPAPESQHTYATICNPQMTKQRFTNIQHPQVTIPNP